MGGQWRGYLRNVPNNAPGIAWFRFGGVAGTTIAQYHFTLVEGGIAEIDAPEVYDAPSMIFDTTTGGKGVTGQIIYTSTSLAGDSTDLDDLKELIASDLQQTLTHTPRAALGRTWDGEN